MDSDDMRKLVDLQARYMAEQAETIAERDETIREWEESEPDEEEARDESRGGTEGAGELGVMEVRFVKTCESQPEQYDAFIGEERVAYLRLRGGLFRVQCPHIEDSDVGFLLNETVYAAEVGGGEFASEEERKRELAAATSAILEWYARKDEPQPESTGAAASPEQVQAFLNELGRAIMPPAEVLLRDRPALGPAREGDFVIPKSGK